MATPVFGNGALGTYMPAAVNTRVLPERLTPYKRLGETQSATPLELSSLIAGVRNHTVGSRKEQVTHPYAEIVRDLKHIDMLKANTHYRPIGVSVFGLRMLSAVQEDTVTMSNAVSVMNTWDRHIGAGDDVYAFPKRLRLCLVPWMELTTNQSETGLAFKHDFQTTSVLRLNGAEPYVTVNSFMAGGVFKTYIDAIDRLTAGAVTDANRTVMKRYAASTVFTMFYLGRALKAGAPGEHFDVLLSK